MAIKNNTNKKNKQFEKIETENKNMFNSITNSVSVENQNQHHNVKKASLGPNTKRWGKDILQEQLEKNKIK